MSKELHGEVIGDNMTLKCVQSGGGEDVDDVLRAFQRIIQAGSKGSEILPRDILTVRSCGRKVVENFRQRAIQARCSLLCTIQRSSLTVA